MLENADILYKVMFLCIAGFLAAFVGGGGLISVPAYFIIGFPPHFTLGTNKFSATSGSFYDIRSVSWNKASNQRRYQDNKTGFHSNVSRCCYKNAL